MSAPIFHLHSRELIYQFLLRGGEHEYPKPIGFMLSREDYFQLASECGGWKDGPLLKLLGYPIYQGERTTPLYGDEVLPMFFFGKGFTSALRSNPEELERTELNQKPDNS
jgi:hypothetical protein